MRIQLSLSNVKGALAVALAVILANCVIQQSPPPRAVAPHPLSNQARGHSPQAVATSGALQPGAYACRLKNGDYEYPPFPCRVTARRDGRMMLDKLAGSQRISGEVTVLDDRRFRFEGLFYCPYGACDEDVSGEFKTIDPGVYRGALHTSTGITWVTLEHLPNGFGGNMYGGNIYGGNIYGGNIYGGVRYGAAAGPRNNDIFRAMD